MTGRITWDGGRQAGPGTTTVAASGRIVVTPLATFAAVRRRWPTVARSINHGLLRLEKGADCPRRPVGRITNAGRIELETPNDDACGSSSGINGDASAAQHRHDREDGWHAPSHLRLLVDNDGTINGPLELESDETVTHTGTFKDVTVGNGVLVVDTGATLTGTTEVADGELRVLRPVTVAALKQTGGMITGAGTLTVTGAFAWSDGDQEGPGATVLAAGATGVVSDNAGLREDRELRNAGTLTIDDATVFMGRGSRDPQRGPARARRHGVRGRHRVPLRLRRRRPGAQHRHAAQDRHGRRDRRSDDRQRRRDRGARRAARTARAAQLERPDVLRGAGTLAGGTYVVGNGAALLLPGPLKANAARLALGAGSQVLYNELTGHRGASA